MGNPFSTTSELQTHSVFTSFVKYGIYWQKRKEERLVYRFLVIIEHYGQSDHCDFPCTLCPEPCDLCAPQIFRAEHGLATSRTYKITKRKAPKDMHLKPKRKRPMDHETKCFRITSVHFKINVDLSRFLETCEREVALLLRNYDATARTFHDAN